MAKSLLPNTEGQPLGQVLTYTHSPCDMLDHSFQYAEMDTVECNVKKISDSFTRVQSLMNNFDAAIKCVTRFVGEGGPYISAMNEFYHSVASATRDSRESLKGIGHFQNCNFIVL